MKENNQVLEARIERLEFKGDYDPRYTKVIHVEHNPFKRDIDANARKMDELVDENMKLKEVDDLYKVHSILLQYLQLCLN